MRNIKYFSLIELALGIATLALGVTAALSLMPVGIKENREATGKNYVALALNDVQNFIEKRTESSAASFNMYTNPTVIPTSMPSTHLTSLSGMSQVDSSLIYQGSGIPGVYAVKFMSGTNTDFIAQLNIWQSDSLINLSTSNSLGGLSKYKQDPVSSNVVASDVTIPGKPTITTSTTTVPITGTISGGLTKINPAASANNEFTLTYLKADGTIASMDFKGTGLKAGTYNSKAMHIRIQGGTTTLAINGAIVEDVKNGKVFDVTSETGSTFKVTLSGSGNKWTLDTSGTVITGTTTTMTTLIDDGGVYVPGVSGGPTEGYSKVVGINAQLSWPIEKPFAKREKYNYYFEVFKSANE